MQSWNLPSTHDGRQIPYDKDKGIQHIFRAWKRVDGNASPGSKILKPDFVIKRCRVEHNVKQTDMAKSKLQWTDGDMGNYCPRSTKVDRKTVTFATCTGKAWGGIVRAKKSPGTKTVFICR